MNGETNHKILFNNKNDHISNTHNNMYESQKYANERNQAFI